MFIIYENDKEIETLSVDPYSVFPESYASRFVKLIDNTTFPSDKQKVGDTIYKEVNGTIEKTNTLIDIPVSEIINDIRMQRNRLLSETDHYALQDVDLSDEMITYRQALRDLPTTVDINNIIYPEKP
jgi:hypothetical protein